MDKTRTDAIQVPDSLPPLAEQFMPAPRRKAKLGWLGLAISAQVLLLAGFFATNAHTVVTGTTVKLKATTSDPRDPLKGEYVQVTYPAFQNPKGVESFKPGERIYFLVQKGEPYWTLKAVSRDRPVTSNGEAFIEARVRYASSNWSNFDLGFDKIYVPEGTAQKTQGAKDMYVELAVDSNGHALPTHLFVDGKDLVGL